MTEEQRDRKVPELDRVIHEPYWVIVLRIPKAMVRRAPLIERSGIQLSATSKETGGGSSSGPAKGEDKVGRNDPCPCGSGKKYKKCCGK